MRLITQKKLRTGLTLLGTGLFLALSPFARGQVSNYSFSQSSGTYSPIAGGTVIVANSVASPSGDDSAAIDDFGYATATIPFSFTFNGTTYTSFRTGSNGYIYFGTTAITATSPLSGTGTYTGAVSGFGADLMGPQASTGDLTTGSSTIINVGNTSNCSIGAAITGTGIAAGTTITAFTANTITLSAPATATGTATSLNWTAGEIRVETIGTSPNRTCVIQFKNMSLYGVTNMGLNFQIRLNEGGGVAANQTINVVYGTCLGNTASTAQVGLRGATNADFNNRTSTTTWAATTAGTSNSASVAFSATAVPASGLTYTWTPATCFIPTAVVTSGIGTAGAAINWTAASPAPSNGYQYEVRSSGAAGSGATGLAASGNTGAGIVTANITGLAASTAYSVYVRSNCGGTFSNWTTAVTFTTSCNATPIPYTQSFDAAGLPSCWTTGLISGTTNWAGIIGSSGDITASHSGAGFMEKNYSTSQSLLYSPLFTLASLPVGGQARVKMWIYRNSSAHANDRIQVSVNSTPSLTGATSLLDIYTLSTTAPTVAASGWYEYIVNIPTSFNAGNVYIIYQGTTTAGFSSYDLGVDDFTIEALPSCGDPAGVNATAVVATSATLNWTAPATPPANGYQYEVRTSGAAGSGATGLAASGNTGAGIVTANVTGLIGATTYSVYVRTNCGSSNFGNWTTAYTFSTTLDCSLATAIACGTPMTTTIAAGTGVYATSNCGFSTPGIEKLYSFTPALSGTYTLSITSATGGYIDYMFKAASAGCGPTGWTCIGDVNSASDRTVTLVGGTPYLFLLDPENATGVSQTFVMKCCFAPTAPTATGITQTSASLSWTQNGTPGQWQVQYGSNTFTLGSGTNVVTSANPYSLTGLTAATSYSYFVRAICGAGDTSVWSPRYAFNTPCINAALPFAENFAAYPASICWSEATGALNSASTLTGTSSAWTGDTWLNGTGNNAAKINIYNNTTTAIRDWMITPTIDFGTGGTKILEFNMGIVRWNTSTPDTLGSDDTLAVVVSPDNGVTWNTANAVKVFTAANAPSGANGSERYYIPLNGYSGLVKIGFYGSQGIVADTKDNDVMVDSILITNCNRPVIALGNDTALCAGNSLTLASGTGTAYVWSNGATTQSINVGTAGTYWVKAINGSTGCYSTDTIVVSTAVTPVVNLGNDTAICAGNTRLLNAGNAGSTYLWNNATTAQTLAAATAGTYHVSVMNAQGCVGRDTIVIAVNANPVVNLGNDTAICPGTILLLNAGNAGASYLWSNATTAQQLDAAAAGTYSVKVMNSNSCVGRDTIVITNGIVPVAALGNDTTICSNVTLTLNAGTGNSYAWNTGATTQMIPVTTAGQYIVTVISSTACKATDTIAVAVTPQIAVNTITPVVTSPSASFTSDAVNATSYAWSFGDNGTGAVASPSHTYAANGTYTVRLIAGNACGTDTAYATVTITGVGIGNTVLSGNSVTLYPNPAVNNLTVESNGIQMESFILYNNVGALVQQGAHMNSKKESIDISQLPSGMYLLRVKTASGVISRKVEVRK